MRDALLELDDMLWPLISAAGWDLHRHRLKAHYVSSHRFVWLGGKPIVNHIDGMWLHYGKSPKQLDFLRALGGFDHKNRDQDENFNAFYLHTRIQVYIGHPWSGPLVRCWLLIATDKNAYDREEFLRRLRNDEGTRNAFYQLVRPLFDRGFFYEVLPDRLPLRAGLSQDSLVEFVLRDGPGFYSGIVKEYQPDEPALAVDRIRDVMFGNFQLLYPLYDFIAWRPGRR